MIFYLGSKPDPDPDLVLDIESNVDLDHINSLIL